MLSRGFTRRAEVVGLRRYFYGYARPTRTVFSITTSTWSLLNIRRIAVGFSTALALRTRKHRAGETSVESWSRSPWRW